MTRIVRGHLDDKGCQRSQGCPGLAEVTVVARVVREMWLTRVVRGHVNDQGCQRSKG